MRPAPAASTRSLSPAFRPARRKAATGRVAWFLALIRVWPGRRGCFTVFTICQGIRAGTGPSRGTARGSPGSGGPDFEDCDKARGGEHGTSGPARDAAQKRQRSALRDLHVPEDRRDELEDALDILPEGRRLDVLETVAFVGVRVALCEAVDVPDADRPGTHVERVGHTMGSEAIRGSGMR
jgi:hypothetical protein